MMRDPRFLILDAMIAAGWGDVPQNKIPNNWRLRRGPDKVYPPEWRKHITEGKIRAYRRDASPQLSFDYQIQA